MARFHVTELPLDDTERVLDLCPDHRDDAIHPFIEGMHHAYFWGLEHDTPDLARPLEFAFGADIALVSPERCPFVVKSSFQTRLS